MFLNLKKHKEDTRMEIEVNEKKVIIQSKDNWRYDGVENTKLKDLNVVLYNNIQQQIEFYPAH